MDTNELQKMLNRKKEDEIIEINYTKNNQRTKFDGTFR